MKKCLHGKKSKDYNHTYNTKCSQEIDNNIEVVTRSYAKQYFQNK